MTLNNHCCPGDSDRDAHHKQKSSALQNYRFPEGIHTAAACNRGMVFWLLETCFEEKMRRDRILTKVPKLKILVCASNIVRGDSRLTERGRTTLSSLRLQATRKSQQVSNAAHHPGVLSSGYRASWGPSG